MYRVEVDRYGSGLSVCIRPPLKGIADLDAFRAVSRVIAGVDADPGDFTDTQMIIGQVFANQLSDRTVFKFDHNRRGEVVSKAQGVVHVLQYMGLDVSELVHGTDRI